MPITIEGTPFSTSAVKRTMSPKRLRPNSARKIPAPTPRGTPRMLARARMNADPTIAFAIPPPASPTGFGVCVRKAQLSDPTPRYTRQAKIANNGSSTRITVNTAAPVITWSVMRRRKAIGGTVCNAEIFVVSGIVVSSIRSRGLSAGHAPYQKPSQRIHHYRHQEQSQSNLDQGGEIYVARGLAEFIRQHTRHRISRREQRLRNLGTISDHHGHGHGLA